MCGKFDKGKLLDNLFETLGDEWMSYVLAGLTAIVIYDGPGCYDSRQKVIFISSQQTESEATQQLVMEISNHQNRAIFAELDAAARTMTRDEYIEKIEQLEFAGVKNSYNTYNKAAQLGHKWAIGGSVYGAVGHLSFEQYYAHVEQSHRETYGRRYDQLTA